MVSIFSFGYYISVISLGASFFSIRHTVYLSYLRFAFVAAACIQLAYATIFNNFQYIQVTSYSSTLLPVMYKLASVFSSNQGILLMLVLFTSFFGLSNTKSSSIIQSATITLMMFLVEFSANPFLKANAPMLQGVGMSPSLQDIAVTYHPVLVYFGYSVCWKIFCLCCCSSPDFRLMLNYSRFAFCIMFSGLAFGSHWAYRELGWGGFWFFDPIENASLLPVMCLLAFHHSLLLTIKKNMYKTWTVFFGTLSFISCFFTIFVTRTNAIKSVHSFANNSSGKLELYAILIFLLSCCVFYSYINSKQRLKPKTLRDAGVLCGNILWLANWLLILSSLVLPIAAYYLYQQEIFIESPYFIKTFVPVLLAIGVLIVTAYTKLHIRIIVIIGLSTICFTYWFLNSVCIGVGLMIIVVTLAELALKTQYFCIRLRAGQIAMLLGHMSYGMLIFTICLTSLYQKEYDFSLKVGESKDLGDSITVNLQNLSYDQGPNYFTQQAGLLLTHEEVRVEIFRPELRLYKIEQSVSSETDIHRHLVTDWYIAIKGVDGDVVHFVLHIKPYITLMWISGLFLVVSFIISFWAKKQQSK